MQEAMEKQAGAERFKQAAILEAEGKKEAMIREAEGKLEAAKKEAEGQIVLAEASSKAIQQISSAVGSQELPAMFLLGDRYIESLKKLAASDNTKTMIYPADLLQTVRGLMGKQS
jgi:regulator of protease activity HflC (stomatin/prohibitin superfamily)